MTDVFSREKRSEIMSRIHQPTRLEARVHGWLCAMHIRHRMYPEAEGRPDIAVYDGCSEPLYVWVHGCFWHACRKHYRRPKSNSDFWVRHIEEAERRRRRAFRRLPYARKLVIWEHEVRDGTFRRRLLEALGRCPMS